MKIDSWFVSNIQLENLQHALHKVKETLVQRKSEELSPKQDWMLMLNNLVDLVHSLNTFHHFLLLGIEQNIYGSFKINHYWKLCLIMRASFISGANISKHVWTHTWGTKRTRASRQTQKPEYFLLCLHLINDNKTWNS